MKNTTLKYRYIFKLLILLVFTASLKAQNFSNSGREFWIPYSYHVSMPGGGTGLVMTLYITSNTTTSYQVEIFGGAILQSGTINAGQVITCTVPNTYFINDEKKFTGKAVRVTSVEPIVVYSYITQSAISGATICLPTQVLGKEYVSMNYTQISNAQNANSYFTIIGVEDNTNIEITPSCDTKGGWLANKTYAITLNKGEIYQVLGKVNSSASNPPCGGNTNINCIYTGYDLSGSIIKSVSSAGSGCKKIAVFSGAGKIMIGSCTNSNNSSDNLYQQLYPVSTWGKKFLTVPSYNRINNYYRVFRTNVNSSVYINGILIPSSSFVNGYYEFSGNEPNKIEADDRIGLTQYFTTAGCSGNGSPYDPDMIVLNPVEQNIKKVTLISSNLVAANPQHHMHVVMNNGGKGISTFKLDGTLVPIANWKTHPKDPNYSYLYLSNVAQGYHTLESDSGFNALAYGYANAETYGYSAGSNVIDLYQFISVQNELTTVNFPASCVNAPFKLSMTFPYQPLQLQWDFDPTLNTFGFKDTTINTPVYDSSWVIDGRTLYQYRLPLSYAIPTAGLYSVKVLANNPTPDGCSGLQEVEFDLKVYPRPQADFTFSQTGCVTDKVSFIDNSPLLDRTIKDWFWDYGDGYNDKTSTPQHLFNTPGQKTVRYAMTTDIGCISDTVTKTFTLSDKPITSFTTSGPACLKSDISFVDGTTLGDGTLVKWTWNFGDGSPAVVATTYQTVNHAFATLGAKTATLQTETSTGCKSNIYSSPITINPFPVADFSLPNICLPSGQANFTNLTSISDGSLGLITYRWDYADGQNGTGTNVSHIYTGAGSYSVKLTATSNQGCVDDTIKVVDKFFQQPKAKFTGTVALCVTDTASFTDQSTALNSTITSWKWMFDDGRDSTVQNVKKRWLTPGLHNVKLVTTSAIGCPSDTAFQTVTVHELPSADFALTNPLCHNTPIQMTDRSNTNSGNVNTWNWTFSDGAIATGSNPQHIFNTLGDNSITLTVKSDLGCVSSKVSKTYFINPLPVASFTMPNICMPEGKGIFQDQSSISDHTENGFLYSWTMGDGGTSNQKNPEYTYHATGPYSVRLQVQSSAGCTDDSIQLIKTIYPQPKAVFTGTSAVCLSDTASFTDQSTAINSTITAWKWMFDDGKDSTVQHVKKRWITVGNHNVRLVAYNNVGCPSDTAFKAVTVHALPTADFEITDPLCHNTTLQLSDRSVANSGNINAWSWSYSDGTNASISNPTHLFNTIGNNNISLSVKSDLGCASTTVSKTYFINPLPVASFTMPEICLPDGKGTFTDQSSISDHTENGFIYSWTMGDGGISNLKNPTYTYHASGPYNVRLLVKSSSGCLDDSIQFIKTIYPQPKAAFSINAENCLNDASVFKDISTANLFQTKQWYWNFGDGTNSNSQDPSHTYGAAMNYTPTFYFIDSKGCNSDTVSQTFSILPLPTASFKTNNLVCEKNRIDFTDLSKANAGNLVKWSWDFNDGGTSNSKDPNHIFTNFGTYNISLQVETDKGCRNTIVTTPILVKAIPQPDFISPEICLVDPFAQFTDKSTIKDPAASPLSYNWYFDDPNANVTNPNYSTVKDPRHTYTNIGLYTAQLKVTSKEGCIDSISKSFTVNGSTPKASFNVLTASKLCSNENVVLQDASSVNFGEIVKVEIYWDYQNDPTIKTVEDYPKQGMLYKHLYPDFGSPQSKSYTIRYIAYSGINCVNEVSQTITVLASPLAKLNPLKDVCQEIPSYLLNAGSDTRLLSGNSVYTGNGIVNSAGLFDPSNTSVGSHMIYYKYTATNGCSSIDSQSIVVKETPIVNAGPDQVNLEGSFVQLVGSGSGKNISYLWSPNIAMNDSKIPNPIVGPSSDITYTLRVISDEGCVALDDVNVKVLKIPQVPNAFSPNGDGINDQWVIPYLERYDGAIVEVYNRYGQKVYYTVGYTKPWDGTMNGTPLSVGTYYWIIDPKNGRQRIQGSVTIIR